MNIKLRFPAGILSKYKRKPESVFIRVGYIIIPVRAGAERKNIFAAPCCRDSAQEKINKITKFFYIFYKA
jgi:hypothetical protein